MSRSRKTVDIKTAKIGLIGAGKIAESIVGGLISYGKVEPNRIHVTAPTTKNLEHLKQQYGGIHVSKRNIDIFGKYDCEIVFICVHGSAIRKCYKEGGKRPFPLCTNFIPLPNHPLYILSLVSGYNIDAIRLCLLNPDHGHKYMIEMHRIMLNCACAYGLGLCAVDVEPDSKMLAQPVRSLLSSIAKLDYVPDNQMDAACAICGSGLAFTYYFISALSDGGFKMGLARGMAIKFAARTVQCASQALLESGRHPGELRDDVCSPSGAAIYGIHILDKADVASGVTAAIEAAHKRAEELAKSDHT